MPRVRRDQPKLWNLRRKVMGNLIPAAVCLPIGAFGVLTAMRTQQFIGRGLWIVVGAIVLLWLLVNIIGSIENPRIKRAMARRMASDEAKLPADAVFVGFARPSYSGILDPHEDIGFLCLSDSGAEFVGESMNLEVSVSEIERVRFRFNAHSLAFLGRWVSIEGKSGEVPFRLLVEPREKRTLLGNLIYSGTLKNQIDEWLKKVKPGPKPGQ